MKSRFTPVPFIFVICLIVLVTIARGQSAGQDAEDGNCRDAGRHSTEVSALSKFKIVDADSIRMTQTKTIDDSTCDTTNALLRKDVSSLATLKKPFRVSDVSYPNPWTPAEVHAQAQADDAQELAKKLSNPIASLISFPFQSNFDFGMGPERKGYRYTLNIQPVIPFALTKDINVISRTILPIIAQNDVVGSTGQGGLGDTIQSFFFSPSKVKHFVWGVGPQLLIPTATNQYLGTQKFGMGPTFVILKQQKGWTYGALVNHTWSVFGKDSRPPVNSTFLQPFVSYTTKNAWTFSFNTESAYDWSGDDWNVPIHFQVSKLMRMGKQPISVGIASRCWAVSGPGGPQGCGFRLVFVPLFPVK